MNQKLSTRALVEGALMTAICVIICMMGLVPVLGSVTAFFYGVPITIVTIRYGKSAGAISGILSVIIVGLFLGPVSAAINGLEGILLGWVIGMMIHNHKSGEKVLFSVLLVSIFSGLAVLIIDLFLLGFSPANIAGFVENYQADMMASYEEMGMLSIMEQSLTQQGVPAENIATVLQETMLLSMKLLPSITVLGRMLIAVITYVLTLLVLKRLHIRIPRFPKLGQFHLPFLFVWILIIVWALWLMSGSISVPGLDILTMNLMLIVAALVLVDGFSTAWTLLKLNQMSTVSKVLMVFMAMFCFSAVGILLLLVGLADLLFDFRKKKRDNNSVVK